MVETYRKAANHQLKGDMFHHEAYLFFKFLGLHEFAKVQHRRYAEESKTLEDIISQCLCRHDMLIEPGHEDIDVVPNEVYSTKASSVGNEYKRKALSRFMQKWKDWEHDTEKFYMELADSCKGSPDSFFFADITREVSHEIAYLHNLERIFELSGYELVQVENLSATCLQRKPVLQDKSR